MASRTMSVVSLVILPSSATSNPQTQTTRPSHTSRGVAARAAAGTRRSTRMSWSLRVPGAPRGRTRSPGRGPRIWRSPATLRASTNASRETSGAMNRSAGSAPTQTSPHSARPGTVSRAGAGAGGAFAGRGPAASDNSSYSLTPLHPPPRFRSAEPGHAQQGLEGKDGGARGRRPRAPLQPAVQQQPPQRGFESPESGDAQHVAARQARRQRGAPWRRRAPPPLDTTRRSASASRPSASRSISAATAAARAAASTAPGSAASHAGSTSSRRAVRA